MATQADRDLEFPHVAYMDWIDMAGHGETWNEACARGIEVFGLPGDRYITHARIDDMSWHFRDHHDLMLFLLAWPARLLNTKDEDEH